MGQTQSTDYSAKDSFNQEVSTEIVVPPTIVHNPVAPVRYQSKEVAHQSRSSSISSSCDRDAISTPLLTFLSGFYQDSSDKHVFFNLNYDDVCRIAEYAKNWKIIPFTNDPNALGIINWIGCINDDRVYCNPINSGMVQVLTSRDYHVNYSRNEQQVYRILEQPSLTDKDCYFDPGCIVFYFPHHMIQPTGYMFRNGGGRGSVVRRWTLEASNSPDGPWVVISNHQDDDSFFFDVTDGQCKENSFLPHCWPIRLSEESEQFYSYFRLQSMHTHPNGRSHALYISGFELYGTVRWSHK